MTSTRGLDLQTEKTGPAERLATILTRFVLRRPIAPAALTLIVLGRVEPGEQHFGKTELCEVSNPHRVERADQVVAFVLHHAGVKAVGRAVDRVAKRVEAGVADA